MRTDDAPGPSFSDALTGTALLPALAVAAADTALPFIPDVAALRPRRRNRTSLRARLMGGRHPHLVRDGIFRRLLALADLAAAAGALGAIGALQSTNARVVALLALPAMTVLAKLAGRYDHDDLVLRKSTLDEIPHLLTLAGWFTLAFALLAALLGEPVPHGTSGLGVLWGVNAGLLVVARATARMLAQLAAPPERVLIVGGASMRTTLAHSLAADPAAHVEIVGFLPLEDERRSTSDWGDRSRRRRALRFSDLPWLVEELGIDRVFITPSSADNDTLLDAVSQTTALGVKVSIVPRLLEVVGSAVEFDTVGGVTVLGMRRIGLTRSSVAVKRAVDIAGAALGLIVLAPFAAIVAIAIKLDSPGPIFFRQPRVGRCDAIFSMIKFRSMVDGAEAQRAALEALNETHGVFKLTADPRVTRVGRFLRRTSIDELPQLINVLRGEMSLVGPRPLVPDEDRLIEGRHRERLAFAPGMTGPWQVLGPLRPPLSEMVKTDYLYAANWSLWTDVKILVRTAAHVFGLRGI